MFIFVSMQENVNGITIKIVNYREIRLTFPIRPDENTRKRLKALDFNWSPKTSQWMTRKWNDSKSDSLMAILNSARSYLKIMPAPPTSYTPEQIEFFESAKREREK